MEMVPLMLFLTLGYKQTSLEPLRRSELVTTGDHIEITPDKVGFSRSDTLKVSVMPTQARIQTKLGDDYLSARSELTSVLMSISEVLGTRGMTIKHVGLGAYPKLTETDRASATFTSAGTSMESLEADIGARITELSVVGKLVVPSEGRYNLSFTLDLVEGTPLVYCTYEPDRDFADTVEDLNKQLDHLHEFVTISGARLATALQSSAVLHMKEA